MRLFQTLMLVLAMLFSVQMHTTAVAQDISLEEAEQVAAWSNELQTGLLEVLSAFEGLAELDTVLDQFEAGDISAKQARAEMARFRTDIDQSFANYRAHLLAMPEPPVANATFYSSLKTSHDLMIEQVDELESFIADVFLVGHSFIKGDDGAAAERGRNIYRQAAILFDSDIRILGAQLFMMPDKHPQGDLLNAMVATSKIDKYFFQYEGQRLYDTDAPDASLLEGVRDELRVAERILVSGPEHTQGILRQMRAARPMASPQEKLMIDRVVPSWATYDQHWANLQTSIAAYNRLLRAYEQNTDIDVVSDIFGQVMDETGVLNTNDQELLQQRAVALSGQ